MNWTLEVVVVPVYLKDVAHVRDGWAVQQISARD